MHTLIQCYAIFVSVLYVCCHRRRRLCRFRCFIFLPHFIANFFFFFFYFAACAFSFLMLNGLFSKFRIEFICHMDQSECVERKATTLLQRLLVKMFTWKLNYANVWHKNRHRRCLR